MPGQKEYNIFSELKPTKNGVIVVLALLFFFPFMLDLLLFLKAVPATKQGFRLSRMFATHYIGLVPFFIIYLMVALLCIYLYRKLNR